MSQPLAVAILHGASVRSEAFAERMAARLRHRFLLEMPPKLKPASSMLAIRPVYWGGVLAERERRLWEAVGGSGLGYPGLRRFVLSFGGDAVAYQPSASRQQVYEAVHEAVAAGLRALAETAGRRAPLCVIAHSLGSVVAHNYLYDLSHARAEEARTLTPLERGDTLAFFYTLGSPLALWALRYGDDYEPVTFPGAMVRELYPTVLPRWLNVYNPSDVLAFPLAALGPGHARLAAAGLLEDRPLRVGGLLTSWNPLSHRDYLVDGRVIASIAKDLALAYLRVNHPELKLGRR